MKKHFLPSIPSISCGRFSFVAALLLLQTALSPYPAIGQGALMPYDRYESEAGARGGGAVLEQSPQFNQNEIASEASDRQYVSLPANGAYVEWTVRQTVQGVNLRFTLPDNATGTGQSGKLGLYVNDKKVRDIKLSSYWAYQYFLPTEGYERDPVQTPGGRTFMRFDEVHFRLTESIAAGSTIRITKDHGDALTYGVDFLELESVPDSLAAPPNALSVTDAAYGAVANDEGDDHAAFVKCIQAAAAQGKNVYIPTGQFWLSKRITLNVSNIKIQGAGIWYTELYFSTNLQFQGGILAEASNVEISHLSLNTANNSRLTENETNPEAPGNKYKIYKGFMGTYGTNSRIHDVWVEHFECGFWIGDYSSPVAVTQNLVISRARIRNNYADGVNFSQGTSNSVVEHSSIRNEGDDGLATWPSNEEKAPAPPGRNNTFRNNTIENNWRAGGIAIFGGAGHKVQNNLIKDGVAGSGIRLNTEFAGYPFEPNGTPITIDGNKIIACGTSSDLWNHERAAIEFFPILGRIICNITFNDNEIIDSQRHAIRFEANQDVVDNIVFNNTTVHGTGLDPFPAQPAPNTDKWGGFAIMANVTRGSATFNNISFDRLESGQVRNYKEAFVITINNTNVPLTGIALSTGNLPLAEGTTAPLTVTYSPANATNTAVTWTSSNPAVATVTATGTGTASITARGAGTAVVTVQSAEGGFTQTCTVTVTPAVNITATDGAAGEGGDSGTFTISTTATNANLTVSYVVGGTAAPGDYAASPALTGSVTLTPAAPSQTITITPVDDNSPEGAESLTLTLQPGTGFALGGNTAATVSIADNDGSPSACAGPAIAFTATPPVIDQDIDAAWNNAPVGSLDKVVLGVMPPDFAGSRWRALYDNTNLYVLVEVKDNHKRNDSGNLWWEDDGVELFLDGDNSKGGPYDGVNDFQFAFRYNDEQIQLVVNPAQSTAPLQSKIYGVDGGYNLEVKIPWSVLGVTPAAGKPIGFEIEVNDDDDGGNREAQLAFASTSGAHVSPGVFGTVALCGGAATSIPTITSPGTATGTVGAGFTYTITAANGPATFNATGLPAGLSVHPATGVISGTPTTAGTYMVTLLATNAAGTGSGVLSLTIAGSTSPCAGPAIAFTATPPTIGPGVDAAWNNAAVGSLDKVVLGTMPADFAGSRWRALYDNTNLYVLVEVKDANKRNDSGNHWWEDDGVELFLDGDNSKGGPYDGINDFQYAFRYNDLQRHLGGNPPNSEAGVAFEIYEVTGGYNLEVMIPWSTLRVTPAAGKPIGFEIEVNDDDDGGNREAQLAFASTSGAHASPGVFGTVTLSSCGGATTSAPVINSSLTAGGSVGSPFSYVITAANGPAGFNATGLPAGLSVDAATGVISGTPTQPGTRSVTLLASNSAGTDTKTLTLAVTEPAGVVTCYRAPGPLAMDGSLDETGWNLTGTVAKNTVGTGNNTVTFGVLWDDTYLYVGAKVLDAALRADSPNAWEDDAIEIFLDANPNQSTTYDGLDNQIVKNYNGSSIFTKFPVSGLQHGWALVSGGYSIEVAIPWSQLGITAPANGTTLGFDLAYDDDDDGGTRDAQAVWHGTGDNFQNTAAFGKLVVSSAQPGGRLAVGAPEFAAVVLRPNPVTHGTLQVVVPAASGEVQVQVMDLQGRTLLRQRTTADRVTLGVAHLAKGAYVALVQTRGKMILKKFVIQ